MARYTPDNNTLIVCPYYAWKGVGQPHRKPSRPRPLCRLLSLLSIFNRLDRKPPNTLKLLRIHKWKRRRHVFRGFSTTLYFINMSSVRYCGLVRWMAREQHLWLTQIEGRRKHTFNKSCRNATLSNKLNNNRKGRKGKKEERGKERIRVILDLG